MKIRKGNSFEILYAALLADGSIIDLGAVDELTVKLYHIFNRKSYPVDPLLESGKLRVKVSPDIPIGDYRLVLNFKFHDESFERDPRVFSIVSNVEDEHAKQPCGSIDVQTISVSDCVNGLGLPGINGKSAYEIWLAEGYTGSKDDFIGFLKLHFSDLTESEVKLLQKPAFDAAVNINNDYSMLRQNVINLITSTESAKDSAGMAATSANAKAELANEAATNANVKAEIANVAAIKADTKAELANDKAQEADNAAREAREAAASITKNWVREW